MTEPRHPSRSSDSDTMRRSIEAVTFALKGDWLDAQVAVSVMTEDELSDLANDLDDLRTMIDGVGQG